AGDVNTVTRLLDKDPENIRAQFAYYEPLHYAVRGGSLPMVKLLLERGAHPKAPGWYTLGDETPIAKAADRGFSEIAELLKTAADGLPPYTWPETKTKTPEELLKFDFEIACGYTPNHSLVESVLTDHPDWVNFGLYEAIHHHRMDMVRLLLAAGGNVNGFMPFACWLTPLMHALRYKEPRWDLAELLLESGVDINGINGLGMSALHIVVFYDVPGAAGWLLDRGGDINLVEAEFCSTPLGWAARWGRSEPAKLLLRRGADANRAGAEWATPMAWAHKKAHTPIIELLKHE
ncbi:MAG: ankyrin repeat domain-containing protein, partial [Mucilaginibacter sp.]